VGYPPAASIGGLLGVATAGMALTLAIYSGFCFCFVNQRTQLAKQSHVCCSGETHRSMETFAARDCVQDTI
jgi:hypothetical protein